MCINTCIHIQSKGGGRTCCRVIATISALRWHSRDNNHWCKLQGLLYWLSHDGCIVFPTKLKLSGYSQNWVLWPVPCKVSQRRPVCVYVCIVVSMHVCLWCHVSLVWLRTTVESSCQGESKEAILAAKYFQLCHESCTHCAHGHALWLHPYSYLFGLHPHFGRCQSIVTITYMITSSTHQEIGLWRSVHGFTSLLQGKH